MKYLIVHYKTYYNLKTKTCNILIFYSSSLLPLVVVASVDEAADPAAGEVVVAEEVIGVVVELLPSVSVVSEVSVVVIVAIIAYIDSYI